MDNKAHLREVQKVVCNMTTEEQKEAIKGFSSEIIMTEALNRIMKCERQLELIDEIRRKIQ